MYQILYGLFEYCIISVDNTKSATEAHENCQGSLNAQEFIAKQQKLGIPDEIVLEK